MRLETLLTIKAENERFTEKLNDAIARSRTGEAYEYEHSKNGGACGQVPSCKGLKEAGAVKRAALDLKTVLTKITSPKY